MGLQIEGRQHFLLTVGVKLDEIVPIVCLTLFLPTHRATRLSQGDIYFLPHVCVEVKASLMVLTLLEMASLTQVLCFP